MRYTNFDRELPPLGEPIALIYEKSAEVRIVVSYLDEKKKMQYHRHVEFIDRCKEGLKRWARLPEFNSVKDNPPPVGESVIFKYVDKTREHPTFLFEGYLQKGQKKITFRNNLEVIGEFEYWLPIEALDED